MEASNPMTPKRSSPMLLVKKTNASPLKPPKPIHAKRVKSASKKVASPRSKPSLP